MRTGDVLVGRRTVLAAGGAALLAPATAWAATPDFAALGWASARGGEDGRVLRVTTLAADGPGSFRAAVEASGPRKVVFDVAGVIDLGRKSIRIREPYLTVAGETAPSPGITFIRGGIEVQSHDVVLRHLRVRAGRDGAPDRSGWEVDGITCWKACDVIVDHCSVAWATDENLSASGPRFDGVDTVEAWRKGTSRRITFSNNIVSEGLSHASHVKGEHSKGTLIHDNATEVLIAGNLYAHNLERNQLFKGAVHAVSVNNLVYDPGTRAMHYALNAPEWEGRAWQVGRLALVGNVVRGGASTRPDLPFLIVEGQGDLDLYAQDNRAAYADGAPMPEVRVLPTTPLPKVRRLPAAPLWPKGLKALPALAVEGLVLAHAGARPWDRDAVDLRILRQVKDGSGRVIDDEAEVGGYPAAGWNKA
ncbi:pectate lyase family protein [Caulobacter endophyticus]|uniref:pectate lyase family protein n=1 Tax=Caulobacter endophyticus TaxID=2172652 RepID=UPI00240FCED7|nr:pectate lyase [Caulobacter endophyticus]MDG2531584.1 pectate lyase [Caulobacter endophyticus]